MPETLQIRTPLPSDEEQVRAAQKELAAEDFDFFWTSEQSWADYLGILRREQEGIGLAPGRVPATGMLRLGLQKLRELGVEQALVICDDSNTGSIRTIEACGGVLEDVTERPGAEPKRRYWIDLAD